VVSFGEDRRQPASTRLGEPSWILQRLFYLADRIGIFALQQKSHQAPSLKGDAIMLSRIHFDADQIRWISGS
jgi:hypothetical protein